MPHRLRPCSRNAVARVRLVSVDALASVQSYRAVNASVRGGPTLDDPDAPRITPTPASPQPEPSAPMLFGNVALDDRHEHVTPIILETLLPLAPLPMSTEHLDELRRGERLLAREIDADGISL